MQQRYAAAPPHHEPIEAATAAPISASASSTTSLPSTPKIPAGAALSSSGSSYVNRKAWGSSYNQSSPSWSSGSGSLSPSSQLSSDSTIVDASVATASMSSTPSASTSSNNGSTTSTTTTNAWQNDDLYRQCDVDIDDDDAAMMDDSSYDDTTSSSLFNRHRIRVSGALNCGVYFPGDTLYCRVSLRAPRRAAPPSPAEPQPQQPQQPQQPAQPAPIQQSRSIFSLSSLFSSSSSRTQSAPNVATSTSKPSSPASSSTTTQHHHQHHRHNLSSSAATTPPSSSSSSASSSMPRIDWITVQIYGFVEINDKWVEPSRVPFLIQAEPTHNPYLHAGALASGSSHSASVASTSTTPAASNATALSDVTKMDVFHATLPPCLPPTFKGLGVRYQYVVMISAQCAKQPMQSIRMPFVLLCPLAALRKISSMQTNSVFNPRPSFIPQTLIVRNASSHTIDDGPDPEPFSTQWAGRALQSQQLRRGQSLPSIPSLHLLKSASVSEAEFADQLTAAQVENQDALILGEQDPGFAIAAVTYFHERSSHPVSYRIRCGEQLVLTITLPKSVYTLGETITGTYDLFNANLTTYQALVILELVEEIEPTMLHSSRKKKPINRKEYDRRCDFVVDSLSSFFSVNLPVEGPQEFQTDLVKVYWVLRFEFLVAPREKRDSEAMMIVQASPAALVSTPEGSPMYESPTRPRSPPSIGAPSTPVASPASASPHIAVSPTGAPAIQAASTMSPGGAGNTGAAAPSSAAPGATATAISSKKRKSSRRYLHPLPLPTDPVAIEVIRWELPVRLAVPDYPPELVFSPSLPSFQLR